MDYQATLQYLYESVPMFQQIGGKAYKEGLDNTLSLDEHLNHPHRHFHTIHIAGTNGKGSCSHTLAAILQAAGYRVGLYTSPHLIDFRERIRIDGKMISEVYVVDFVAQHRSFFEPLQPSFFELTTAMAFRYFADEKVDVAIIEVGLGGRLDCTNIITPDLSIITNISFDHMQFLGNTLEDIAKEKAGIIKKDIPVVIGEASGSVKEVFKKKAQEIGAPIIFAEEAHPELSIEISEKTSIKCDKKSVFSMHYALLNEGTYFEAFGELCGEYQKKNGRTIFTAAYLLREQGYKIEDKHIKEGLEHVIELTGIMGRWQILQHSPTLLCDTGHNVAGISYIVEQLTALKMKNTYNHLHIVIGMMHDKDVESVLKLLPQNVTYYFAEASVKRSLKANVLKEKAIAFGLQGNSYDTVSAAVKEALEKSLPEDLIFVGGSNFIVADLLASRNTLNLD